VLIFCFVLIGAQELAKEVWGAEYRELIKKKKVEFVDKYSLADLKLIEKEIPFFQLIMLK